jgi:hypothetical protein
MRVFGKTSRGSLTLVALCFTAVIGIALASYLALSYQSYQHSERTLQLNRARHLAETGLEEALWSLNNGAWTNATWTVSGVNTSCTLTGYDMGEGATGSIAITINNYNSSSTPSIKSVGTVTLAAGGQLTKTLNATTKPAPLYPNAIASTNANNGGLSFNSGGTVDSWNSNPSGDGVTFVAYATPGSYNTAVNCAAVVAAPNIALGSATVYGYATTFGNSVGTTGSTKIKGPTTPGGTNIDTARVGKSAFVPVYPVAVPASYSVTGTLDGSSQTIGTPNGPTEYWSSPGDLTLNATTITVQGPAVIIVHGSLTIYSGARIVVNATGQSRLELFVSSDVSIGITPHGSTTWLDNLTNQPRNFALYSTSVSSFRAFNYYTSRDFCGVIYSAAPAPITVDTATTNSFCGALLCNDDVVFVSGTAPNFHYDTYLQNLPKGWFKGVTTPFLIVRIDET